MSNHVVQSSSHGHLSSGSNTTPSMQRVNTNSAPHADIAKRAYEKYQARGAIHGFDRQDWAAASRELTAEKSNHLRLS